VFEPQYTKTFEKALKKEVPKNHLQRIKDGIQKLVEDPYHNTEFAKGRWRGKRKLRVGDYRIVFVICEECQKEGHNTFNQCDGLGHQPCFLIIVALIVGHDYNS